MQLIVCIDILLNKAKNKAKQVFWSNGWGCSKVADFEPDFVSIHHFIAAIYVDMLKHACIHWSLKMNLTQHESMYLPVILVNVIHILLERFFKYLSLNLMDVGNSYGLLDAWSRVSSGLFIQLAIFSKEFSHNNSNIGSGSIPEA